MRERVYRETTARIDGGDLELWSDALRHAKRYGLRVDQLKLLRVRADADGHRWDVPKTLGPMSWHGVELCWNAQTARLFAADCAEHVLHIYEAEYPGDMRPREAISVARLYAKGDATAEELEAARAADTVVWAAWAAPMGGERAWQRERLAQYLLGEIDGVSHELF